MERRRKIGEQYQQQEYRQSANRFLFFFPKIELFYHFEWEKGDDKKKKKRKLTYGDNVDPTQIHLVQSSLDGTFISTYKINVCSCFLFGPFGLYFTIYCTTVQQNPKSSLNFLQLCWFIGIFIIIYNILRIIAYYIEKYFLVLIAFYSNQNLS